jgi:hypothetical protein
MKRSPRSLRNSLPDADERKFPRDRYAKVDGLRLRYWVRGHGENVLLLRPTPKGVKRYISRCFADPGRAPAEWVSAHVELATLPGAQQAFLAILRSESGPNPKRAVYLLSQLWTRRPD